MKNKTFYLILSVIFGVFMFVGLNQEQKETPYQEFKNRVWCSNPDYAKSCFCE